MYFRNLTMFRFPQATANAVRGILSTEKGLQGWLAEMAAKPCGPLELSSRGWVSPFGADSEALFHQVGDCLWLTLGGEDKILPAAAVNAELAKRVKAIEEREGRRIGGKARKQLKDDLIHELLPKALAKPYRLNGYLDLKRGVVFVDTSSRKQAELWVSELRHTLGSFPALPLNAEVAVAATLTNLLVGAGLGQATTVPGADPKINWLMGLGDEAQLQDPVDGGGVARFRHENLLGDEVRQHMIAGKQCTTLGLVLDSRITFTVDETVTVRKLKLLDVVTEQLEAIERDSIEAELDARFALLSGEVGQLFDVLEQAFHLSKAEG